MKVPIKTTNEKFYRQLLELLKPFPPINACTPNELDVLGHLLYYNDFYIDISLPMRDKIIFDYDTMIAICNKLNMNEYVYRNILTQLRKKSIVDKKSLKFRPYIKDKNNYSISFIFSIDNGE